MKNQLSRDSRRAPKRRGTLPPGTVHLGFEKLEERALMAGDLQFQNPTNRFDVNNDGAFNRLDIFTLIGALRLGGERRLSAPTGGAEGEAPATGGGTFYDVNGDDYLDRRDIFSSIGAFRAEGEFPDDGATDYFMNYSIRIFSADGTKEFFDPDGTGPLGINVPKDSDFLVRVFVQDTGAVQPGKVRDPALSGIGTFSLDVGYHETGSDVLGNITPKSPIPASGPVAFEGTVTDINNPGGPKLYQFPGNTTVPASYVDGITKAVNVPPATSRIQAIQGTVRDTNTFLGLGEVMAFEIPFTATGPINTSVIVQTLEFTPQPGQSRIQATQDGDIGGNVNADTSVPQDGIDDIFTNAQILDAQVKITIVDNTFANNDLVILHEQTVAAAIPLNVKDNDFIPANAVETGVTSSAILTTGTVTVDNKGTADRSDDDLVYTPNDPYFVGVVTFTYQLQVFANVGDFVPSATRTGTVTVDFREFNFAPIVSATGADEALLAPTFPGGVTINIDQGEERIFVISGGTGLLTNDLPGDPNDNGLGTRTPLLGDENRPNQNLHIVGDPRTAAVQNGITYNFTSAPFDQDPAHRPFVVPAEAARTIEVDGSGNLRFVANPTYSGPAVIHYFVEDNGLEQSLTPLAPPPLTLTPKATAQTLAITINDVADVVRFHVEFFDTATNTPLLGEANIGQNFTARVFVEDLQGTTTGVERAFIDLSYQQFDPGSGFRIITAAVPTLLTSAGSQFNTGVSQGFINAGSENFINDTGGVALAGTTNTPNPLAVFDIQLTADINSGSSIFQPLFAPNRGAGAPIVTVFPNGSAPLKESQIDFVSAELLVASGARPVAFADGVYALNEGDTLNVLNAGDRTGGGGGLAGGFNPAFGVLNNDTDGEAAIPGNTLFGQIVDLSGITRGTLFLRDPNVALDTDPGAFIQVTGPGAQAPPVGWAGTFRYVPKTAGINGTDTFTYRAVDSDGRRSLLPATTVTITIAAAPSAPVAIDDIYEVDAIDVTPGGLVVAEEGNRIGDGLGTTPPPLPPYGVLNNDIDPDVNADPNAPPSVTPILTAHLDTAPAHGVLTLIDDVGGEHIIDPNNVAGTSTGFVWTGRFKFVPDNVRGITDTFTYHTEDDTGLLSNTATVFLRIDLKDVTVKGRVIVDDSSPVSSAGVNPYPNTIGGNGRFEFQDFNLNGKFDVDVAGLADKQIERTLGGVSMTLFGTTTVGGANVSVSTRTNSQGLFNFATLPGGGNIPAGDYQLIQDPRLKNFFFDGVDMLNANSITAPLIDATPSGSIQNIRSQGGLFNPTTSNDSLGVADELLVDHGLTDVLFTEMGLRSQFIGTPLVSTSRSGVTIGLDNTGAMVWYTIDSGPGWSVFEHEITGLTIANNLATLSFTEAGSATPVSIHVPTASPAYGEVIDSVSGYRVIRISGTAANLKLAFP